MVSLHSHASTYHIGLGPNKDQAPTDWRAVFGGPAWSPSGANDGQWYYHMFTPFQPDFNWNNAEVREDFLETLRFWGDRGVSGFRIDVAHALTKDMTGDLPNQIDLRKLTNQKLTNGNGHLVHPIMDRDDVHEIYKEWRKVFNQYNPPLTYVHLVHRLYSQWCGRMLGRSRSKTPLCFLRGSRSSVLLRHLDV
jgi:alpha-glucosidase